MPLNLTPNRDLYSPWMGLVYVFNLIVGTGALTLPAAFQKAGWLLGLCLISFLSFMSFITSTFVVEAMAATNAMLHWKKIHRLRKTGINRDEDPDQSMNDETEPLVHTTEVDKLPVNLSDYYTIDEQTEMGKMAATFFGKVGLNSFFAALIIYLYGDLAIYGTAIAKSLRDVACVYVPVNYTCNMTLNTSDYCWGPHLEISRSDAYRIFLGMFALLLGPFAFFNVQKTKYLQMLTTLLRWISFSSMIVLASIHLASGVSLGHPATATVSGIPNFLGVCVYSFMCHHSLPALLTPINNKDKLFSLLGAGYALILLFYNLLSLTAIFSFSKLQDLYTLNFQPSACNDPYGIPFLQYFLVLYPVSTLSTNFPIVAITLRNNLKSLCLNEHRRYGWVTNRMLFPMMAIGPPLVVSFITENLEFLVGITGSYAGAAIQYVVPALLVYHSRTIAANTIGLGVKNHHSSPFRHTFWVVFVNVWAAASIVFVTVHHIVGSS